MIALHAVLVLLAASTPEPSRPYDVQHYRIDLRLANNGAFENEVKITLTPSRTLATIDLDSYGLDVQAASLEGKEIPFTQQDDPAKRTGVLTLRPRGTLAANKPVTFAIRYKGQPATAQEGFFRTRDFSDPALLPYYFTHFEPDYARRFFPSNDRPDDKATTELFAIVDARYTVLSNGAKLKDETYSEKGDQLRRVHWRQDKAHPTYAFAVAIGQFEQVETASSVPASLWVQPLRRDRAFLAVSVTEHALPFQERYLGVKYPWAKHDQVSVPNFFWGGMENTSLVFQRENGLVLEEKNHIDGRTTVTGLVAHELAHQWFGDYVTCKRWADIWLNEGFATFLGWKTEDDFFGNDLIDVERATATFVRYFREEDGPRSHPLVVRSGPARDAFDATSYTKGAHVLRMMEHWVGEERFRKGLRAYLEQHALGNATSEDFFATFMKATSTDRELRGFRDAWLYRRGYPMIVPETSWDGTALKVTIRQRPNHAEEKGPFVFKLPIVFHRDAAPSYAKEAVILVDKPEVTARFELPAAPRWVNWNAGGVALVRIEPSSLGEQSWIAAARLDPDPVWRTVASIVLLGEIANPHAKEQKPPSDAALDALYHVIRKDSSPYVREAVLRRIAKSSWKRVPAGFAPAVFEDARRPNGLPEDALGTIRVRRAAMAALGKVDAREARQWLLEQMMQAQVELNYYPAIAEGVANIGDAEALTTLRAGMRSAKARGYAYYKHVATKLGAVTSPEVVPAIEEVIEQNPANDELLKGIIRELQENREAKHSPELAAFVRAFVVENRAFGDDATRSLLRVLDEVKTKEAQEALVAIRQRAESDAVKESAARVLASNFASAAPAATTRPAKGVKKKKR
jgi:aminopeptidase N